MRGFKVHVRMDILARRLYNGGFNHLKRRTGSLIISIPRPAVQAQSLARLMSMHHQVSLVNTDVRSIQPHTLSMQTQLP